MHASRKFGSGKTAILKGTSDKWCIMLKIVRKVWLLTDLGTDPLRECLEGKG